MTRGPARCAVVLAAVLGALALLVPAAGARAASAPAAPSAPGVSGYVPLTPARLLDTRPGGTTVDATQAGTGALGPGASRRLPVTGRGGVPALAVGAVVLNVTAVGPTAASYVTAYPTGVRRPTASNLNVAPGQVVANLVITAVGGDGTVTLFNASGHLHLVVDVAGWFPAGGDLHGLTPTRLLDTRAGGQTGDGQAAGGGAVGPGATRSLQVAGRAGVPATGVGAVVLNLTATAPSARTWVTGFPAGAARPLASNLNAEPGQTVANLVVAKLGTGGRVDLYNAAGSTHLVVDVAGWLPSGSSYTALPPARLADTRPGGATADGALARVGAVHGGSALAVPVAGRAGVPATGAAAVVLNVTATEATAPTWLTVHPQRGRTPVASNLNVVPGRTVAALVVAAVGPEGSVQITNAAGAVHLVVDVLGWVAPVEAVEPPPPTSTTSPTSTSTTAPTTTSTTSPLPEEPDDATIPLDGWLSDLALSPDGTEAYVVDDEHDVVHRVDLEGEEVLGSLPVGDRPVGIDVTPDGSLLAVLVHSTQDLVLVDLASWSVLRRVPVPVGTPAYYRPLDLAFGADGIAVLAVGDGPHWGDFPGHVYLYDPATDVFTDQPAGLLTRDLPDEARITASGDRSRITLLPRVYGSSIYDVGSRTWHVREVAAGPRGSVGVDWDGTTWVGERAVLDEDLMVDGSLPTSPYAAAVDRTGDTAYVVQEGGIDVIELEHYRRTGLLPLPDRPGARMALTPDGARLVLTTRHGVTIVPTADPGPPRALPEASDRATIPIRGDARQVVMRPDGLELYVTNQADNTVEVISMLTRTVVGRIPVGSDPRNLDVSPDGTRLFVTNSSTSTVSMVDLVARRELQRIELGRPDEAQTGVGGVAVTAERAYVTLWDQRFVGIDVRTGAVVEDPWAVDGEPLRAGTMRTTADHRKVVFTGPGPAVWTFDEATDAFTARETNPSFGELAADATAAMVAVQDGLIGPGGDQLATIEGDGPLALDALGTRHYRATTYGITVVETSHFRPLGSIPLPEPEASFPGPNGMVLTPDGLWAAVVTSGGISIVSTLAIVPPAPPEPSPWYDPTVPLSGSLPDLLVDPTGQVAYVARPEDNSVEVVSIPRRERVATILVGSQPVQLDLDPTGRWLYVANSGGDNLSVVDTLLRAEVRRIRTDRPGGQDFPTDLAVLADGRAIVATDAWPDPSRLLEVRLATGAVEEVSPSPLGDRGCGCQLEASGDRQRAVLTARESTSEQTLVAAYDARTDRWTRRFLDTWWEYTLPLAVDGDGGRAMVGERVLELPSLDQLGVLGGITSETMASGYDDARPTGIVFAPDGSRVFHNGDRRIDAFELEHFDHLGKIPVQDRTYAGDLDLTPDGRTFVARTSGGISIVDADGLVPPEVHHPWSGIDVSIHGGPTDVVVDAEGRYGYVSVSMENVVEVVDVAEQRSVAQIPVGSRPVSLDLSPDGTRLYVANHGGADVSVVDVATRRELRRIRLPGDVADLHPVSLAVAGDGVAFVARNATTDLVRIDLATEVATVEDRPDGSGYPLGLSIAAEASADRSRLAVFGAGLRSTYDAATHTWSHVTQDGFDRPAFDATGDRLVIGGTVFDRAGDVVAELDLRDEDLTVLDPTGTLVWAFDEHGAHAHEVSSGERVQSVPLVWTFSNRSAETDVAVLTPDGTRILGLARTGLEVLEVTPAA